MFDRIRHSLFRRQYILRDIVSKLAVFTVIPGLLNQIKMRGISGELFNIDTFSKPLILSSLCTPVSRQSVEKQNDSLWRMLQQQPDKFFKINRHDVAVLNRGVPNEPVTKWRKADRRNDRECRPVGHFRCTTEQLLNTVANETTCGLRQQKILCLFDGNCIDRISQ
jgi:hypothetical protein